MKRAKATVIFDKTQLTEPIQLGTSVQTTQEPAVITVNDIRSRIAEEEIKQEQRYKARREYIKNKMRKLLPKLTRKMHDLGTNKIYFRLNIRCFNSNKKDILPLLNEVVAPDFIITSVGYRVPNWLYPITLGLIIFDDRSFFTHLKIALKEPDPPPSRILGGFGQGASGRIWS